MTRIEKAFLMGVGFHYLATRRSGFFAAFNQAAMQYYEAKRKDAARVVDPHNRAVE